jgi:hypothetical protein
MLLVKALVLHKLAVMAVLTATALADAALTNRSVRKGRHELNPIMRPFAGTGSMYAANECDVALADVFILERPKARMTKAIVGLTFAGHLAGIGSNLMRDPMGPKAKAVK